MAYFGRASQLQVGNFLSEMRFLTTLWVTVLLRGCLGPTQLNFAEISNRHFGPQLFSYWEVLLALINMTSSGCGICLSKKFRDRNKKCSFLWWCRFFFDFQIICNLSNTSQQEMNGSCVEANML